MPKEHPWDQSDYASFDWLPWGAVTQDSLPEVIGAYYQAVTNAGAQIQPNITIVPEQQEDGKYAFFLVCGDKKIQIMPETIIPPQMYAYLDVVNDLPKLKKICAEIQKMDLSASDKQLMLQATLFFHHLLGSHPISLDDIKKCFKSEMIAKKTQFNPQQLEAFATANFAKIEALFAVMQVELNTTDTPNIVITAANTGAGLISKVNAIDSLYASEGIKSRSYDVGANPDSSVLKTTFGQPFIDQASAWSRKAAKSSAEGDQEFMHLMTLESMVGALLGVPRSLEVMRKNLYADGVTHLVSTTNFKPSIFIGGLGCALGIPVALISTNHYIPDAVKIAAATMPKSTNVTAFIQDPTDIVSTHEQSDNYTVLGCPVDPAFKKTESAESVHTEQQSSEHKLDTYHGFVAISLGGVDHVKIIEEILKTVPNKKQYIIALGNQAKDEFKQPLLEIARARGLNIGFADEFFGETGKKLTPAQMNNFYNASDLVIAKPGGSTTAELPAIGVPAIFIKVEAHNHLEGPNLNYLLAKYPQHYQAVSSIEQLAQIPILSSNGRPAKFQADEADWRGPMVAFAKAANVSFKPF